MSPRRVWFAQGEVAELSVHYRAGVSLEGLSRLTGRDRRVLRRVLAEAGVQLRTRQPLPCGQLGWVIEQYQAGATLRELAACTGCSASSIRRLLARAGVRLRPRGTRPSQRSERTVRDTGGLLDGGWGYVTGRRTIPVLVDRDAPERHVHGKEEEGA